MLEGVSVMFVFSATWTPLKYIRAVVPFSVMATCVHWPSGSAEGALMTCSAPAALPLMVIAKRGAVPALVARNMKTRVPEPKSKMRDHVGVDDGLTQAAIVKSCRALTIPLGSFTSVVAPSNGIALPNLPATRGTVTGSGVDGGGATLTCGTSYLAARTLACTS